MSEPNITGNEWEYVRECLDSGWVSSAGEFVNRFEANFARAVGAPHAVAVASGTAALHVALHLSGVRAGDEVVVPTLTFIAPANAVRYLGAYPVFVDVDPTHWQIDPREVEAFLAHDCQLVGGRVINRHTGRSVRAILPVDILGHPADLDRLYEIAADYGLGIVEDATESLGALYRGRRVGHGHHLTCFSFNGNKLITTGGGGMITTDNNAVALRARYLSTQAKDDPINYVHREVGFNYRLTNVQAAIGCAQLERLDEFLDRKRAVTARYDTAFTDHTGITTLVEAAWATSACWLYTILIDPQHDGRDRNDMIARLSQHGVQARPLWQPLHQSVAHTDSFSRPCPTAEAIHAQAVSLPSSTGIQDVDVDRVIDVALNAPTLSD